MPGRFPIGNAAIRNAALVGWAAALLVGGAPASAQVPAGGHDAAPTTVPAGDAAQPARGMLRLSAGLMADAPAVRAGLVWRVFDAKAEPDGSHALRAQSTDAEPVFTMANGSYLVHVAYGFASAMKRVEVADRTVTERLNLNAGGIEVKAVLGDVPITPDKLSLSIYVPERGNSEAKLIMAGAKPNQIVRLPEGLYHVVSTYLDTVGVGSLTPVTDTNSIVSADLRVQAGKLTEATVRHMAAVLTLKLVNAPGGEALANTSFTILTPGGDIIRELIGAFPSLVLAEGDYLVIARHNGKTFQSEFKVESNLDRDVEVIAQSQPQAGP